MLSRNLKMSKTRFILLCLLISAFCFGCKTRHDRFRFIDYDVVVRDLKANGKTSTYYKTLNFEAMIYLDTNCISTLKKINPNFISENDLGKAFFESINFKNKDWTWEQTIDIKNIKELFDNKKIFDLMCTKMGERCIDYSKIDSTVYIKNDKVAIFTTFFRNGWSETYRAILTDGELKLELLQEIMI